jgi:putative aldouronate transport system permease protein
MRTSVQQVRTASRRRTILSRIQRERFCYLLILPSFIATAVFCYWPMYGLLLAFKDLKLRQGILGSPWVGLKWFELMFQDPTFLQAIRNTLIISFGKLIFGTFACILLALLLNELRSGIYKKVCQTLLYLPRFLSWVIMASIIYNIFTMSGGLFTKVVTNFFHREAVQILANPAYFRTLVFASDIWKGVGFGTIVYLAAIAGIDPELYEAGIIDGASRLQRVLFITIPCIKGTIIILLILSMGGVMNAGFDQILNLYSPNTIEVGDIIDTYVYRRGVQGQQYSYSTAVGLFKNAVNVLLLITVNYFAKLIGEQGLY